MDRLLTFTPEPFPELDQEAEEYEFDSEAGEWESEATDQEVRGRRRPQFSPRSMRRYTKKPTLRGGPTRRSAMPPIKPFLRPTKVTPRPWPMPSPRLVPIPLVPPLGLWTPGREPAAPADVPRPEDRRTDRAGPEGSGSPPGAQPSDEPASEYVRWVQECLNRALGLKLAVDGIMNRETRSAVRLFQERKGVAITGLVGPKTEAKLGDACRLQSQDGRRAPHAESSFAPFQTDAHQREYSDFEGPEFEEDLFLGSAIRSASRAVSRAARSAYKTARKGAQYAGSAYKKAARFAQPPGLHALTRLAGDVARGKNVLRAIRAAAKAGIADVRDRMRYAQVVASFVPGIGTGVAAALGAANALAAGRPITEAVIDAARAAIPGGPLAQAAFDVGVNLARGRNLSQAALAAARNRLPVGARAAFDTAVALGKGQGLQKAAWAGAGHVLARSPFAANALAFARQAGSGRNLQFAALSPIGRRVHRRVQRELGELEYQGPPDFEVPTTEEIQIVEHELHLFKSRLDSGGVRSRL